MTRKIWLLAVCLLLAGCGKPIRLVVDVRCENVALFQPRILLRLPGLTAATAAVDPAQLPAACAVPTDRLAVIGLATTPGLWRFPPEVLRGERSPFELSDRAFDRLERFRLHVVSSEPYRKAAAADRPTVLAAHLTRALSGEIVAKHRADAVFVGFDDRAPGLEPFAADSVRELVELAGPKAACFIWLRDSRETRLLTTRARPSWSRDELRQVLNGE